MHAELPSYGPRSALTRADRVDAYLRVLNALMMRDMRTRFFGSWWGYLIAVMWPVAHMFVIAIAMSWRGVPPPLGDSAMVFAATGAIPALAFQYISREMMKGATMNKPLTYYPQVRMLDVAFARVMVEVVNSFLGVMIIFAILTLSQLDPVPLNIVTALGGYVCAILFGIGMGMINVAIVIVFPGWSIGYMVVTLGIYFSSGVVFLPSNLPEQIYTVLKWNPVLQMIEWVRLGYEPDLPVQIDYFYIVMWILCTLALGLFLERTVAHRFAA